MEFTVKEYIELSKVLTWLMTPLFALITYIGQFRKYSEPSRSARPNFMSSKSKSNWQNGVRRERI
jgi:hypothetical protein